MVFPLLLLLLPLLEPPPSELLLLFFFLLLFLKKRGMVFTITRFNLTGSERGCFGILIFLSYIQTILTID